MKHGELPIDDLLEQLSLTHTRHTWREVAVRATNEQWSPDTFLAALLVQELLHRRVSLLHQRAQLAQFPFLKTLQEFDFGRLPARCRLVLEPCLERSFVTTGNTLLLIGPPASGKTHLAVAVAYQALQSGFDALHVDAQQLRDELAHALDHGQWREALGRYSRPDVLLIDHLDGDLAQANLLFLVLNERHLAGRSTVLTSRHRPEQWGATAVNRQLAALILDRLLARGQILYLDDPATHEPTVSLPPIELSAEELQSHPPPPLRGPEPGAALRVSGEARRHRRYHVELHVSLTSDHNFFSGFGRDLSEGGIFIATYDPRQVGEIVEIDFLLPSAHRVRTSGVVRWQRTASEGSEMPGIGVEFLALRPDDQLAIEDFFRLREPIFHA